MKKIFFYFLLEIFVFKGYSVKINFYGKELCLDKMYFKSTVYNTNSAIQNTIDDIYVNQYKNFIKIDSFCNVNVLDDVGKLLLCKKISETFKFLESDRTLFIYTYFLKDGVDVILKYDAKGVLEVAFCSNIQFAYSNKKISKKTYYSLGLSVINNYWFFQNKLDLNEERKLFDFKGIPEFLIDNSLRKKIFYKDLRNKLDSIIVLVDTFALEYYKDVPKMLDYNFYIKSKSSKKFVETLTSEISKKTSSMDNEQKIKLALLIIQSLPYFSLDKTGVDRFLFPEETFFYEKSDCEDRSFLLAYILTNILNIPCSIMDYKVHVNVGIKCDIFNCALFVKRIYNGNCYIIAETTNRSSLGDGKANYLNVYRVFNLYPH